jgi:hypothetical protein
MARPKKVNMEVENINSLPVVPVVESSSSQDALMKIIADLQNQITELSNRQYGNQNSNFAVGNVTKNNAIDLNRFVTIVHLLDNSEGLTTHISISSREIDLRKFGDTIRLRLTEFEELFYKYQSWFEMNMIALTKQDEDLAENYGIKISEHLPLNSMILNKIQYLPESELENLYNSLTKVHKDLIIKKWAMGYYETDEKGNYPKNVIFKDKKRVKFLNELSNEGLKRILEDMENKENQNK